MSMSVPLPPRLDELVLGPGEPMESSRHLQQMTILLESLQYAWRDRNDFFVGADMFLYFSETQAKRRDFRGPDLFVVMNTERRERKAWVVWLEDGQVPDVIIELLSDSTAHVDRGEKMVAYARLRVGEYFLFDPFSADFEGYALDARGNYQRKAPNERGHLVSERLGLSLGIVRSSIHAIDAPWLRWIGSDGEVLPTPFEVARANGDRADAEKARGDRLAAELEALKRR
jgi:Uma2 family endonuclease